MSAVAPLIDCHSDVMIDVNRRRSAGETRVFERIHLPELRHGGVAASICTVGGDPSCLCPLGTENAYESALGLIEALRTDISGSSDVVQIASSASEARRLIEEGIYAVIPALEGAAPLEGKPERVEEFHTLGVRSIGLTWNTRNEIAVGLRSGEGGLSAAGRDAVREMNRVGVLVDLAHASPTTFWDVVAVAEKPFIVSHANARSIQDSPRNLDDEQLRALKDADGFVGVVLYPPYVGPLPVSVENVLDHIEYLVEKVGIDHVGIGADFIDYAIPELVADYELHNMPYSEENFTFPKGVETCRSLSRISDGLRERGFSEEDIGKVAAENILGVIERVEVAT
jgi:membrane dipeptidase